MKRLLPLLLALCLLPVFSGCSKTPEAMNKTYYQYFDTISTVVAYPESPEEFEQACGIVEGVLKDYHALCDIYYTYEGINNLKTINDSAGQGPVTVDQRLLLVLDFARQMEEYTAGYCNAAMGSVFALWHESRESAEEGRLVLPEETALRAAAEHSSMDSVILDFENVTVALTDPDMRLDLGGIAKGYATEQAAKALENAGYTGYALSIGGNVRVVGSKYDHEPWVSGIQNPNLSSESAFLAKVAMKDQSLVTSGSYQRYFDLDGYRYHHIIHPDSLRPENEFISVSILCRDSGVADALSTAVFNMTLEDGLFFIRGIPDTEACWILADGTVHYSDGLEEYIVE